ncbi:MAG TPA: hypothetical protein VG738_12580 [Chitinophagaceae bacterium]|nr:hypothetical protein [Chitinophagaceae bacterium]
MEQNTIIQELLSQVLDQQNKTNTLIGNLEKSINELREQKAVVSLPEEQTHLEAACNRLPDELQKTQSRLSEIRIHIGMLKEQLKQPVTQQIKHQHRLDKGFIIGGILFAIVVGQLYFLLQVYDRLDNYKANDIKYRMLKLSNSPALLRVLNDNDSIYLLNKDKIEQVVEIKEHDKEAQLEALHVADEKEKEAKQWRQRAGKGNTQPFKTTKTQPTAK